MVNVQNFLCVISSVNGTTIFECYMCTLKQKHKRWAGYRTETHGFSRTVSGGDRKK